MAHLYDMVMAAVSGVPGTGPITMGPAVDGFRPFSVVPDGTLVSYTAGDNLVEGSYLVWETGRGTYTQTQTGYTGTVSYPDVGAVQHLDAGSSYSSSQ